MTQLTAEEIQDLRNKHEVQPRWLCGARSHPTSINHATRVCPALVQVCTEPQGHEGDHEDKRHCYQFGIHRFPESQVSHYEPEDWSMCSCGRSARDCPVPRLLDALEEALATSDCKITDGVCERHTANNPSCECYVKAGVS